MTEDQHATSAAITISSGQSGVEEVPSLETVRSKAPVMRDLSVVSPPIPDMVTRSVTGPGETSLLGVIRSGASHMIMCDDKIYCRQGTSVSSVSSIGSYSFTVSEEYKYVFGKFSS